MGSIQQQFQDEQRCRIPPQYPSLTPTPNNHDIESLGTSNETPPHKGPGTSSYVRQPTRVQLKEASSIFSDSVFYYKDPEGIEFRDENGHEGYGVRWIRTDLRDGESESKCSIM